MKKTFLFSACILLTSVALKAQTNTFPSTGNVGIGTTTPAAPLDLGNSVYVKHLIYGSGGNTGYYMGFGIDLGQAPNTLTAFIGPPGGDGSHGDGSFSIASATTTWPYSAYTTRFTVLSSGNVGIGTTTPTSLFQVDDGCTKASIGDASGGGLNYGTSYLGFNASRSGTSWLTNGDGGNNGGGVMYSSIFGDMYFSIIPSTGSSGQTLADANVKSNIAMRIDHADGAVYAKKVYVQLTGWPDYVFKKDYKLMPLAQVKSYIDQNQHLPGLPTDKEVEGKGLDVGEMNKLLTKKVEELTLYLIEQNKKMEQQQNEINLLKTKLNIN
jgi:hypothetical protein